jgi:hypothetical protein
MLNLLGGEVQGRRLKFQRRLDEPGDSRSESCKIADVPGQQSICSRLQGAMSNECIIMPSLPVTTSGSRALADLALNCGRSGGDRTRSPIEFAMIYCRQVAIEM